MALSFRCFKNKVTGQVCYTPAGRYGNFLNSVKKLVNYVKYNIPKYYVVHLTLTLKEAAAEIDFKHFHRVMQFIETRLKRADSDFKYIAVKEIQKERLEKYGEEAVHYHVLCIYSKPYIFPHAEGIAKSWTLGSVKITAPKIRMKLSKIIGYIGKYIGKGYEYETLDIRKSFTASQIKQIYKLSPTRLAEVIRRVGKGVADQLKCTYRKIFIEGYEVSNIRGIEIRKRVRELIMEFPSDWVYEGIYDEPF
jgi:hypothetical protein